MALQPLWTLAAFYVSQSYTQSVGLLGRGISPSQSWSVTQKHVFGFGRQKLIFIILSALCKCWMMIKLNLSDPLNGHWIPQIQFRYTACKQRIHLEYKTKNNFPVPTVTEKKLKMCGLFYIKKKHPISHLRREMISRSRKPRKRGSISIPTRNVIGLENMCNIQNGKGFPLYRINRTEYSFYTRTYFAVIAQSLQRRAGWPAFDFRQQRNIVLFFMACRPILGPT
jgi:hypothetical protein